MNKKGLSAVMSTIIIIVIALASAGIIIKVTYDALKEKDFTITDNLGNETDFVIKIVDCTLDLPIDSDKFYVNDEYVQMQRYYWEKVNETHARACWYDAFKKESINSTWLNENCDCLRNSASYPDICKEWSCDKEFIVR